MKDNRLTEGVAKVSVKEYVALNNSVNEKDQTIGALQAQIDNLKDKLKEQQKDQKVVVVRNKQLSSYSPWGGIQECGTKEEIVGYRNLDSVIEDIRKEESNKLGISVAELETKLNKLELEKQRIKNDSDLRVKQLEEQVRIGQKEKDSDIATAKEKIRKHMTTLIDGLNDEIDDLKEELRNVKKDKSNEAIEDARKQEIIDLKEQITALENQINETPNYGWFKTILYNWLKVDARAKIQAEREHLESKDRVKEISNNYPSTKGWWTPAWMPESWTLSSSTFGWM
jgi:predicted phage tail protein